MYCSVCSLVISSSLAGCFGGEDKSDRNDADNGSEEMSFFCGNGDEIPLYWVNDLYEDCEDGSDEQQYDEEGGPINWFDCFDGSEIYIYQVNDGNDDCPDGDDEDPGEYYFYYDNENGIGYENYDDYIQFTYNQSWNDAVEARGLQPPTQMYMYDSNGVFLTELEVCPLFSEFAAPNQRMVGKAVIPTPHDGFNKENLVVEIAEPNDFEGSIAVFTLRNSSYDANFQGSLATAWTLAQTQNASAVILSFNSNRMYSEDEFSTCQDVREKAYGSWESFAMSQVGVLSVPLIMIQPSDYQKILSNESRIFEMGPHGFVKQGG